MTCPAQRKLIRLDAIRQQLARLRVERSYPGRVQGVSLITSGPAAGHDFSIDRTTVEQVTELASGMRGRWTHGGLSDDGLGRHLGKWENLRTEPFWLCGTCRAEEAGPVCETCSRDTEVSWRSVGDFLFAPSAYKIRPDGLDVPAPVYLMERAQEDPESLGISIVARFSLEQAPAEEGKEPRRLARIMAKRDLRRGDWVADPAANPVGLHAGTGAPSELTEGATRVLDRMVSREGKEKAKTRALAFLARYFGDVLGEEVEAKEPAELGALRVRVDALRQELVALRETVVAYREAEEARIREEADALLARLRAESAELNAPIPAADLTKVEALLEVGDFDTARILGEAFLARSEALGQEPFRRGGTRPLAKDRDRLRASVAARARLLRRRGWTVEVTDDGTEIKKENPPRTGGRS